jgi:hypothetical protein
MEYDDEGLVIGETREVISLILLKKSVTSRFLTDCPGGDLFPQPPALQ